MRRKITNSLFITVKVDLRLGVGATVETGLGADVEPPGMGAGVEPCPVISPDVPGKLQTGFWQHGWS